MEFHEKLQELRKQRGLTQEELAEKLYVSRTAISKWESGRGYPNIDSLKAIAACFSVTVDQLLSGDELLTLAQEDTKQKADHLCDLVYGLLDVSVAMFFFLPFFGQTVAGQIHEVSLLALTQPQPWLLIAYFLLVTVGILLGILTLSLQSVTHPVWVKNKHWLSVVWSGAGAVLFMISLQPYAALYTFVCLTIKVLLLLRRR